MRTYSHEITKNDEELVRSMYLSFNSSTDSNASSSPSDTSTRHATKVDDQRRELARRDQSAEKKRKVRMLTLKPELNVIQFWRWR